MKNKTISLITKKIEHCNEHCFCIMNLQNKALTKDQRRCGNCHSKDILIELLKEVNDLEMIDPADE